MPPAGWYHPIFLLLNAVNAHALTSLLLNTARGSAVGGNDGRLSLTGRSTGRTGSTWSRLARLERGQVTRLVVHIQDLLLTLLVECTQLLTRRGIGRLLEVRAETLPSFVGASADAVLLVHGLCALGGLETLVELLQGQGEAIANAVLLVEGEGTLDGLVADHVAMGEVFGHNAGAGLVLLCNVLLMAAARGLLACTGAGGGGDVDRVGTELGVVEEQGRLGGALVLEVDAALWRVMLAGVPRTKGRRWLTLCSVGVGLETDRLVAVELTAVDR